MLTFENLIQLALANDVDIKIRPINSASIDLIVQDGLKFQVANIPWTDILNSKNSEHELAKRLKYMLAKIKEEK